MRLGALEIIPLFWVLAGRLPRAGLGGCLPKRGAVGWSMAGRAGANTPVLGIGWAVGAGLGGCLPKRGAGWWSATGRVVLSLGGWSATGRAVLSLGGWSGAGLLGGWLEYGWARWWSAAGRLEHGWARWAVVLNGFPAPKTGSGAG